MGILATALRQSCYSNISTTTLDLHVYVVLHVYTHNGDLVIYV